jgi:hypothetical protein
VVSCSGSTATVSFEGSLPSGTVKLCIQSIDSLLITKDFSIPPPTSNTYEIDLNAITSSFQVEFPGVTVTTCANAEDEGQYFDSMEVEGNAFVFKRHGMPSIPTRGGCVVQIETPDPGASGPGGRSLRGEEAFPGEEDTLQHFLGEYGDVEFEVRRFVTDHLYALAIPSPEGELLGCPHFAVHARKALWVHSFRITLHGHWRAAKPEKVTVYVLTSCKTVFCRIWNSPQMRFASV